jgi:8-oxo-dGTP diphosphatase
MDIKEDTFHLGVKALIQNNAGQLLILRKTLEKQHMMWDLPGGRMQRNESMEEALEREVFEETGLKGLPSKTFLSMALSRNRIALQNHDVGLIFAIYLCPVQGRIDIQLSDEHLDYSWVVPQEAAKLLKPDFPAELIQHIAALQILIEENGATRQPKVPL